MIDFLVNLNPGLGDCLSVFTTHLPCWSPSPHFEILKKYSSIPTAKGQGNALRVEMLHQLDLKGHHLFNRARIVAGLEPLEKPRAILDKLEHKPVGSRICFNFDVGAHAANQTNIHPRARQLYPEHKEMFQRFFTDYRDDFEFIEVGAQSRYEFEDVWSLTGVGLDETIQLLSGAQAFITIHSGLEHIATAMEIPTCSIINFPEAAKLNFKYEGELDLPDAHWLYPQNTILHMDEAGGDIKKLSRESLEGFLNEIS